MVSQFDTLPHAEVRNIPQGLADMMVHAESSDQEGVLYRVRTSYQWYGANMCKRCPVIAEGVLFRKPSSVSCDSAYSEKHEETKKILRRTLYISQWHVDFVVDFQHVRSDQKCMIDVKSGKTSSQVSVSGMCHCWTIVQLTSSPAALLLLPMMEGRLLI